MLERVAICDAHLAESLFQTRSKIIQPAAWKYKAGRAIFFLDRYY